MQRVRRAYPAIAIVGPSVGVAAASTYLLLGRSSGDPAARIRAAYPAMAGYADALVATSRRLGVDPAWLANIINAESRGNPAARNPTSDASGLIQFMPSTAAGLGTSTTAIRGMSGQQQMPLVERYFQQVIAQRGALRSQEDVIAAVFYPAYIGRPLDTFPLAVQQQNRGMRNIRDYTVFLTSDAKLPVAGIGSGFSLGRLALGVALVGVAGAGSYLAWRRYFRRMA